MQDPAFVTAMAWEKRGRNHYYYQSERDEDGQVRKKYIGTGDIAETVAHTDLVIRLHRETQREKDQAELERLESLVGPGLELDATATVLAWAHLIAAGYHRHKGEWRRERST